MKRIGLISDTHGYLDDAVFKHFENCDEIWHAGDFGNIALANKLAAFKPVILMGRISEVCILKTFAGCVKAFRYI
jgi:predicted phosphodiesterase